MFYCLECSKHFIIIYGYYRISRVLTQQEITPHQRNAAGDGSDKDRNSASDSKDDKLLDEMDDDMEEDFDNNDERDEDSDDYGDENECVYPSIWNKNQGNGCATLYRS